MPNKIALAARKMETFLGAEFETLDWILCVNVDLKIGFISWLNLSLSVLAVVLVASSSSCS